MANKTIALHTDVKFIAEIDRRAKILRRSRNSLINEAVELFLYPNGNAPKPPATPKKKAGTK